MFRFILIPFIFSACISTTIQANDFDRICQYFETLEKLPKQKSLSHIERNQYILEKIKHNLDAQSHAKVAWDAISHASAEQRYELFKSGAESTLKNNWECRAMKRLANITGVFK